MIFVDDFFANLQSLLGDWFDKLWSPYVIQFIQWGSWFFIISGYFVAFLGPVVGTLATGVSTIVALLNSVTLPDSASLPMEFLAVINHWFPLDTLFLSISLLWSVKGVVYLVRVAKNWALENGW